MSGVRLGRGFPNNQLIRDSPYVGKFGPQFDSASASGGSGGQGISWTHTVGSKAKAAIAFIIEYTNSGSPAIGCTFGGTAMTQLGGFGAYGNTTWGGGSGYYVYMYCFGLLNPPTGSVTVSTSISGGTGWSLAGASVAYTGVSSFGTFASATAASTSASHTVSAASGQTVVQAFMQLVAASPGFSSYSQTQRFMMGSGDAITIGDAPGASSVLFGATAGAASPAWGSLAVPLNS